jgi:hypothetical protein
MWLKQSSTRKLKIIINGEALAASEDTISKIIKQKLVKSKVIRKLFDDFGVSLDKLKDMKITIKPLEDKYAETDADVMKLNESLFDDDFFEDYFFVCAHEIIHMMARNATQTDFLSEFCYLSENIKDGSYFADKEELGGFISSIAYEIERGVDDNTIYNRIYPKIEWHFHDAKDAQIFFSHIYTKAKKLVHDAM